MVSNIETIDARLLRSFVAVARRLGVTAAAEALGQPKSRVSKALSELERRLGARLLERSTRRIALTRAGTVLLGRAESILAELDRLAEDVREQVDTVRGIVRFTAPPELGAFLAHTFFPGVLSQHPALELALELGYSFEDLFDPRYDLAIRLGSVHDERLVARRLGSFRRVPVASPGYVKSHPVRRPEDLRACECLIFSGSDFRSVWTFQPVRAGGGGKPAPLDVPVQGRFAAHGFSALLDAARAGLGVARVPDFLAQGAIERGEVIRLLPRWQAPATEVFLVHRFGHDRVRRVAAVIDAARASLAALLPGRP